jgi:hypothetical protein
MSANNEEIELIIQIYDRHGNHFKNTKVTTYLDNDLTHISNRLHQNILREKELHPNIGVGHFLFHRRKLVFYSTLKQEKIPQNAVIKFMSPYFSIESGIVVSTLPS